MALLLTLAALAVSALLGSLTAALLYLSWNFNYWKERNVSYFNPLSPSTLIATRFRSQPIGKPMWLLCEDVYWKFKDQPFVGFFQARRPSLVVRDPDLIKLVLTKEFSSFHDRGIPYDAESDPFSVNLVTLQGEKWKNLRAKLSPTFTSGKLKLMFPLMTDVVEELKAMLKQSADAGEREVNMKDLLMRCFTDIIGSCAFGANCNSLKNPKSEFLVMGRALLDNSVLLGLRFILLSLSPIFLKVFRFDWLFAKQQFFFTNLMKETVRFREENGVQRNDFVSLMMKLKDSDQEHLDPDKHVRFDDQQMAVQAFVFFLAGLDAVVNIVGLCLHTLAFDEDLQRRAAQEVRDKVREHDGELSYEALRRMDLVQRIVMEALRLWGPGALLVRDVTRPFRIPGSDLVLDKTPNVIVPVWQLHHDPAYYPDPDRFDPDRFTEEARRARHPYVYLPFGEGPRICIAQRFAMLEMQLCLASLLQHFRFSPGSRTETCSPTENADLSSPTFKSGFWLIVDGRE